MRIRSVVLALVAALLALPSVAQDVAGKWNASVETPNGPFPFVFEFLVDAAGKLTGSMQNDFGATPISDGVVNGNDISFSKWEGTPPPGGQAEASFTATRAK
jgi:hypothetical protein